jgi:hypothetical protein
LGRSRKDPYSLHRGNFCRPEGEKKLFPIIVNVLGHPKEVRGLTSYSLCGGGMMFYGNGTILGKFVSYYQDLCNLGIKKTAICGKGGGQSNCGISLQSEMKIFPIEMGRSRKYPHSPHRGNFCRLEEGRKIFSHNSKCIWTSEGGRGGGVNLRGASGGGMDEMCTPDLAKILTFYGMYFALGMS